MCVWDVREERSWRFVYINKMLVRLISGRQAPVETGEFFYPITQQLLLDIIFSCKSIEIFSPIGRSITISDSNLELKFFVWTWDESLLS